MHHPGNARARSPGSAAGVSATPIFAVRINPKAEGLCARLETRPSSLQTNDGTLEIAEGIVMQHYRR